MKLWLFISGALALALGLIWTTSQSGPNNPKLLPSADSAAPTQDASLPQDQASKVAEVKVKYAPDFSLLDLSGKQLSVSDFRDQKAVILDFWASWCPNCQRDMPKLSGWHDKYQDKVAVIGVNLQESESIVRNYIKRSQISFPVVFDPRGVASNAYAIRYTNTHFLINKAGVLVKTIPGDISEADIIKLINEV